MNLVLTRIDNRLIHGQVATAWTQHSGANLLLVANDNVAEDKIRQNLMDMAKPAGVQARYFSVQKTIDVIHKASDRQIIALIVETPQDVVRLVEGGVEIKYLNIGNMHMSAGKKQISKSVCVDEDDKNAFKRLNELGVKLEIQRVPNEQIEDILKLI